VELVEVEGRNIYVHLKGACVGCQMAGATLGGVQQALADGLGEMVRVLPAEQLGVCAEA
jgi:NifU-like protein